MGYSLSALISFLVITAEYSLCSEIIYECPPKQEVSCEKLRTKDGYKYSVPSNMSNFNECEQAWNLKNGTCIANSGGEKINGFVKDATRTTVTIFSCEPLQWELRCHSVQFDCFINYTVIDPRGKEQESQHAERPDWRIALPVSGAVIVMVSITIAVWVYRRKQGNG